MALSHEDKKDVRHAFGRKAARDVSRATKDDGKKDPKSEALKKRCK